MVRDSRREALPQPTRRPRRFFSDELIVREGTRIVLSQPESHHLRDSLRLVPGSRCLLIDREGREAEAELYAFTEDRRGILEVKKFLTPKSSSEPRLRLRFYVAIPQRGGFDFIVEKAQEMGVDELVPFESDRTLFRIPQPRRARVYARWEKIAREASKQSGALPMTKVDRIFSFKEALSAVGQGSVVALFHPESKGRSFAGWLAGRRGASLEVKGQRPWHLFIGPEGGFSAAEVDYARRRGAFIFRLGDSVLKVETAFLAVAAILRYGYGIHPAGRDAMI